MNLIPGGSVSREQNLLFFPAYATWVVNNKIANSCIYVLWHQVDNTQTSAFILFDIWQNVKKIFRKKLGEICPSQWHNVKLYEGFTSVIWPPWGGKKKKRWKRRNDEAEICHQIDDHVLTGIIGYLTKCWKNILEKTEVKFASVNETM